MELLRDEKGLYLSDGSLTFRGDYTQNLKRLIPNNLNGELLIKAARFKDKKEGLLALDATAGLGDDSLLLAAYGFKVILFERDNIIYQLLQDTMERAKEHPGLFEIVSRMEAKNEDSITAMQSMDLCPDLILLDPMFPVRNKSGLIKKKFQLIKKLEAPCENESDLLSAAISTGARKIVIKRPAKGPYLSGIKPSYSISGKTIRYDCISHIDMQGI